VVSLLLRDSAHRMALGEAGRVRVATHFTMDAMMSRLTSGYEMLLGQAAPASQAVSQ